ncbi:MAG: hypothetical protein WAM48_10940 [Candidatus Sulfotelmatobacter sp.]
MGFAVIVVVVLAFFAVMVPRGLAQGRPELKRPEPDVPQEKPAEAKKKPVKGPRAVALLQLTGGKATLIPIAILVDGKFYDASEYKADPVPMALDSGTVYEAEDSGDSLGLFTVSGALHSKTLGAAQPWFGAGSYMLNGTAPANAPHKAENVPVGLNGGDNDAPPRLTREKSSRPEAPASPGSASASGAPASTTSAGTGSSGKPGATNAPAAASPPVSGSSGSGASTGQKPGAAPATDKPADQGAKQQVPAPTAGQTSPAQSSPSQSTSDQSTSSQTADYYRPTLRRGKPMQGPPPDVDDDAAPKAGKPGSPASAAAAAVPVKLVPAISDAGGPEPKSYKFFWKTGEEDERRNQMLALAGNEVLAYVKALARNQIPANPPAKAANARHETLAKPIQPVLENVQFHAFDVWSNNQIVMILTADAHFPPAPGATAAQEQYSITLVTRTDIYGDLRKLYSGVTDKFHLDVTPRMELIDVVDADGDGRGELLFRETTDAGKGYVIYRAGADKLFKMFDSLAEEE